MMYLAQCTTQDWAADAIGLSQVQLVLTGITEPLASRQASNGIAGLVHGDITALSIT